MSFISLCTSLIRSRNVRQTNVVLDALNGLAPLPVIEECYQQVGTTLLVEQVALKIGMNPKQLLEDVAARLNLHTAWTLKTPSEKLVQSIGIKWKDMSERYLLPQESFISPSGCAVVAADPGVFDYQTWKLSGIDIVLGLGGEIAGCWKQFSDNMARKQGAFKISEVLHETLKLAEQAQSYGAREIFIGHPDRLHYEFMAGENRYAGKMNIRTYELLVEQLKVTTQLSYKTRSAVLSEITFTLTTNGESPVVFVHWVSAKTKQLGVASKEVKEKPKVFILDEDDYRSVVFAYQLEQNGFEVTCFQTREQVFAALKASPSMLLCEKRLADDEIAKRATTCCVPLVVIHEPNEWDSGTMQQAFEQTIPGNASLSEILCCCRNVLRKSVIHASG